MDIAYLKDLVVILGVAVVVVASFHRFGLPSIAGFILSGILVGPHGFALINDSHQVEILSEVGVALLLFGIGLQLPLNKLKRLWRVAVVGGFMQVGLTIAAAYAISSALGLSSSSATIIGFVVALSSTAIVLRGLQQRGEVDAPHGRLILGILVFQDFAVVPMMLVIPLLAGVDSTTGSIIGTLARSVGIIVTILVLATFLIPRALKIVARTRQRHLFTLSVFVICLGIAWLVTKSGASLAIGAFLAGLVVAGSDYRHQALSDLIPFREVFASLFFVSIGMLLSVDAVVQDIAAVVLVLVAILVGKAAIVFLASRVMRMPARACLIAALSLAQVGEFSFVLLYAVRRSDLIAPSTSNILVSAAIVSMFITPFLMSYGPKLAAGLGRFAGLKGLLQAKTVEEASSSICKMRDHVIIAGFGFAGRELARALKQSNVPFVVVDLNFDNVSEASSEFDSAVFGDVTSEEILAHLGVDCSKELVLLINDPVSSEQSVRTARALAPHLQITVRTTYLLDVETLMAAGADDVIPAEREATTRVLSQVLARHQVTADHTDRNLA